MQAIFDLWPSAEQMATDLGEKGVTVRAWKARGNIPADRDVKIVEAARRMGKEVSYELLAKMRAGVIDMGADVTECNVLGEAG